MNPAMVTVKIYMANLKGLGKLLLLIVFMSLKVKFDV